MKKIFYTFVYSLTKMCPTSPDAAYPMPIYILLLPFPIPSFISKYSIRGVLYRIKTCTWGLSRITHSLALLGRALFLNNTLAFARVLFRHNERCAHVML